MITTNTWAYDKGDQRGWRAEETTDSSCAGHKLIELPNSDGVGGRERIFDMVQS
jgi:hypothetical protein